MRPLEVRERAVRMVLEQRGEYPSLWAALNSDIVKIGRVPRTLLSWVQRHEVKVGARDGVTTAERQRVKELERENKELRRENETLKLASVSAYLEFTDENLPRNASGKLLKNVLRGEGEVSFAETM